MKNRQYEMIIETAANLFAHQGIKATTMEEIAKKCKLSKKTLYLNFFKKELLVQAIVQRLMAKMEQHMRVWPNISPNAISELMHCFQYLQSSLTVLTALFLNDLQRYYHLTYNRLCLSGNRKFVPYLKQNVDRGILEDLYRKEIDNALTSKLYYWQLTNIMMDLALQPADQSKLFADINSFLLQGIVTADGNRAMRLTKYHHT